MRSGFKNWAHLALGLCLALSLGFGPSLAKPRSSFESWSSVVIAADWRDGQGEPIEAFDNARRDLSSRLIDLGFPSQQHVSLTLNPSKPDRVTPAQAFDRLRAANSPSAQGCIFYLTSHGTPSNIVFGDTRGLEPVDLITLLRQSCGARPTIVVLSACYSGSFVDALKAPNRMIITSARRDRTSFGCGAGEVYPWFDACVLETLPHSLHFLDLAVNVRTCVASRETEAEVPQPSEPQVFVGADMQIRLPTLIFNHSP